MTKTSIKERLLLTIRTVIPFDDYHANDCIFSEKYDIATTDITYILLGLSNEFNFVINDDFVDAMEMCTFSKLEELLEKHENTKDSIN